MYVFFVMTLEQSISEAEKMVWRKAVEKKIRETKKFFASAVYKEIVWNEDDDVEGYEEDALSY
jgi:hypothetical protein